MARRRRLSARAHRRKQSMLAAQVLMLAFVLLFVLLFRGQLTASAVAFLDAFGEAEDVRVAPHDSAAEPSTAPP